MLKRKSVEVEAAEQLEHELKVKRRTVRRMKNELKRMKDHLEDRREELMRSISIERAKQWCDDLEKPVTFCETMEKVRVYDRPSDEYDYVFAEKAYRTNRLKQKVEITNILDDGWVLIKFYSIRDGHLYEGYVNGNDLEYYHKDFRRLYPPPTKPAKAYEEWSRSVTSPREIRCQWTKMQTTCGANGCTSTVLAPTFRGIITDGPTLLVNQISSTEVEWTNKNGTYYRVSLSESA